MTIRTSLDSQFLRQQIQLQKKIIDDNKLEKEDLFPPLQCISQEKDDPFLCSLTFPEFFLEISESISTIAQQQLTRKHKVFAKLNQTIEEIKKNQTSYSKDIQEPLEKIKNAYENYVIQVIKAKDEKTKRALLTGPCRLYGIFHQKLECYRLSQKKGRYLTCLDEEGQTEKPKPISYGEGSVRPQGNVFYKRPQINNLNPGMEYAVSAFNRLMAEGRSPPIELLKIINVCLKNGTERNTYFLQASYKISGKNLHEFLESPQPLNKRQFTSMVISAFMTIPSDGRADNYIASPDPEGTYAIVGVDNDQSFDTLLKKTDSGSFFVKLKTVLFTLPEMNDEVDRSFINDFLDLKPEEEFIYWLKNLEAQNKHYESLLDTFPFLQQDYEDLSLPIQLRPDSITRAYDTIVQLQKLFNENPHKNYSHFEVFSHLFPEIAKIYSNLSESSSESKYASLRRSFSLTQNPLPTLYDAQPPQPIMNCIEALTKKIFPSLTRLQQESFLRTLFLNFPDLSSLELSNIQLKEVDLSRILSHRDSLKELILKQWQHITGAMLLSLFSHSPQLKLSITPESLSSQDWKDLLAFSWQEKRDLTLLFPEDSYPTTEENRFFLIKKALEIPYFPLAQALLELNAEVCKGCPPLHFAAMENNEKLTEYLLDHDADFSSYQRNNPIHVAALCGSLKVLRVFQKKIPQIFYGILKAPNSKGENPLHKSTQSPILDRKTHSKKEVVAFLLSHILQKSGNNLDQEEALNPNVKDYEGYTPLHYAVKSGDLDTLQFLEECGGNLELLGKDKKSLLHLSVLGHHLPITDFLIEKRCNPNQQDSRTQTPLHYAVSIGNLDSVTSLCKSNTLDITIQDRDGHSPLWYAITLGDPQILNLLLHTKHFNSLSQTEIFYHLEPIIQQKGINLLHAAVLGHHITITDFLIEKGYNPNYQDNHGQTPLHYAILMDKVDMVASLCKSKLLDVTIANNKGRSPLWYAIELNRERILHLLLHHNYFESLAIEALSRLLTPFITMAESTNNKKIFEHLKLFEIRKRAELRVKETGREEDYTPIYDDLFNNEVANHRFFTTCSMS